MFDIDSAILEFRASGKTDLHAMADNLAFEECLSPARRSDYLAHPSPPKPGWKAHHAAYVRTRIECSGRGRLPDSFQGNNALAHLGALDGKQELVRLESIDWVLADLGIGRADFQKWFEIDRGIGPASPDEKEEARTGLDEFIEFWNQRRDNRPSFAAFADELVGEMASVDWADLIRDRLGLGHYAPLPGSGITVLRMRYPVSYVQKNAMDRSAALFVRPIALDGGLNPWFFPAPRGLEFGRTLDLQKDEDCARHIAEILHQRIDYRVSHIDRLGEIRRALPGHSLRERRNQHLFCLQLHSDRHDFGQDIPDHVLD